MRVGPQARASLIDLDHQLILAHPDATRILQPTTRRNEAVSRLSTGQRGTLETTDSTGAMTLSAFTPAPGGHWGLVILEPSSDAFAPADAMVSHVAALLAMCILAVGAASAVLAWRVVRPLARLKLAVEAMAEGDLESRAALTGGDEIAELGLAFDHMADQLRGAIGKLEAREAEMAHQATHDSLTGLANRALFVERLEHALSSRTSETAGLAVLYLDLDNFKFINDSLGHSAGDELLCAVAGRLRSMVRAGDTVARLGGDEFSILLPGVSDARDADAIAVSIRHTLAMPLVLAERGVTAQVSIGIALAEADDTAAELLRKADLAMYEVKTRSRSHQQSGATLEGESEARQQVEEALREGESRFRAVFDNAPMGIQLMDSQARVLEANRAMLDMIGYDEDEIRGLTCRDFGHPDEEAHDAASLQRMRGGSFVSLFRADKRYRHKDGHAVRVHVTGVPVLGPRMTPSLVCPIAACCAPESSTRSSTPAATPRNWRWCCLTWIASKKSTTPSGTTPATFS